MFWPRSNSVPHRDTIGNPMAMFNRFFGSSCVPGATRSAPAFNLWSDESGSVLTSELPGVKLEDLDITVSGSVVTVKAARKEEQAEKETRICRERPQGQFERAFDLSYTIDAAKVEAKLANGVLEISLPRAEAERPRKISINVVE